MLDDMEPLDFAMPSIEMPELPDFDFQDDRNIHTAYVKPPAYRGTRHTPVMYDHARKFVDDIGPSIMAGERVDAVLSGNFVFGDFFEAFLRHGNMKADELTISTLSMSQENVGSLSNCLRCDFLERLNIVISDYWFSHNRQNLGYIYEELDIDGRFRFAVAGTHTKIALLRVLGRKLVIHGSANLRSSRSVEVMTFEHNPPLYDFHRGWHEKILTHYSAIKGATRASQLYDLITGE